MGFNIIASSLSHATGHDILHPKWIIVSDIFFVPPPCPIFFEHSVVRHMNTPRRRVVEPPGFGARLIANEHHHGAVIF
jgi:hypothetical protein